MSAITFDTHKIIKRLEASGVPIAQAEATVEAFADMVDAGKDSLATKADLSDVEHRLEIKVGDVKSDVIKWMIGISFAQVGLILTVIKLFLH